MNSVEFFSCFSAFRIFSGFKLVSSTCTQNFTLTGGGATLGFYGYALNLWTLTSLLVMPIWYFLLFVRHHHSYSSSVLLLSLENLFFLHTIKFSTIYIHYWCFLHCFFNTFYCVVFFRFFFLTLILSFNYFIYARLLYYLHHSMLPQLLTIKVKVCKRIIVYFIIHGFVNYYFKIL